MLVAGKGLLGGDIDHFDIVAGVARLNADLFTRDLLIAAGGGRYDFAARNATGGAGAGVVIDSSLLGGMYANRIRLIGTAAGVGINLQGTVAALQGDLVIDANGAVTVRSAVAQGDVSIKAGQGTVAVGERLYATGSASVAGGGLTLDNSFVGAAKDVSVSLSGDLNANKGSLYAGLAADGGLKGNGALTGDVKGALRLQDSRAAAAGDVKLGAGSLSVGAGSSLTGDGVDLTLGGLMWPARWSPTSALPLPPVATLGWRRAAHCSPATG